MNQAALKPRANKAELRKTLKRIKALFNQNRLKDAKPLCDRVFAHGLDSAEFLHLYGLTLRACDNLNDALLKTYAAHEKKPTDARILNSLGLVFLDMQDTETAITMFKRATAADQKCYNAWENLGMALRSMDRFNSAILAFTCAHHLDRSKLDPLFNIALLQADMRRYEESAKIMDELLESHKDITPGVELRRLQVAMKLEDLKYVEQHQDNIDRAALTDEEQDDLDRVKAQYLEVFDRFDEAIEILEKAVARKGKRQSDLISHLGYCYGTAGRIDDGIATLKNLLDEHPDHYASRYNLSLLQFRKGDVADGFENYETRWQFRAFPSKRRKFDAPIWRGEPVEGKNVLVWREQGLGDEVRYASLLPELQKRGCSITFECTPKLIPLWEATFPWARIRPEGEELCLQEPEYAEFDYQVPIGSLGYVFRKSIADFDENQKSWIARDHDAESQLRTQLAVQPNELLIGVCWRSMNQIASRDKVFLNCEQLAAFKDLPNARWLNLQYASAQEEIDTMRKGGLDMHHYVDLDQKNDLVGACNLLGACDLIISVGGSVGDLAGGVGTPLVYMTREQSEAFLGTDHVPWFVNCKSYPIPAYKSDETIARIVKDWPSIAQWAEDQKPEDRKASASASAPRLDLEYPLSRRGSP
ncbi:MAG: tetratricopeptide repeat protein [Alphaproteobacteria bacterium]|nr:tetratricopeptide repeat protein [Alphaproteobacteria bacterium]